MRAMLKRVGIDPVKEATILQIGDENRARYSVKALGQFTRVQNLKAARRLWLLQ
jgi:hypothetical protein